MPANHRTNSLQRIELAFEAAIFASRWMLAPAYVLLVLTLAILTYKTFEEFVQLIINLRVFDESHAVLQVLTIVDLVLVLNLVLLVVFVGYINFVSKIETKKTADWPNWMTNLGYSGLKVQLLGSVIAIATVKMLRTFLELSDGSGIDTSRYMWMVIVYACFLFAVLCVALVNLLGKHAHFVEINQRPLEPNEDV